MRYANNSLLNIPASLMLMVLPLTNLQSNELVQAPSKTPTQVSQGDRRSSERLLILAQNGGGAGRLYSVDVRESGGELHGDESYLVSKHPSLTEDGAYVDGIIRVVNIDGDDRQSSEMGFIARCAAANGEPLGVSFDDISNINVVDPNSDYGPSLAERSLYNLWWAACYDIYRKY